MTVVIYAKYRNDWTNKMSDIEERGHARFELFMDTGRMSCIAKDNRVCCSVGYLSKSHLKRNLTKSRLSTTCFSVQSLRNFAQSDSVVLRAKLRNDWATEIKDREERDFVRVEFKMNFLYRNISRLNVLR